MTFIIIFHDFFDGVGGIKINIVLLRIILLGAFLSMLQVHVVADNISNSDNRVLKQIERWWQNEKSGNSDIQYISHRGQAPIKLDKTLIYSSSYMALWERILNGYRIY